MFPKNHDIIYYYLNVVYFFYIPRVLENDIQGYDK